MVVLIQSIEAGNFIKNTFKTVQFNENRLFIGWLKSGRNYSGKKPDTYPFVGDALKTRALNI